MIYRRVTDKEGPYINKVTWDGVSFTIHYYDQLNRATRTEDGTTDLYQCLGVIEWFRVEQRISVRQRDILKASAESWGQPNAGQ